MASQSPPITPRIRKPHVIGKDDQHIGLRWCLRQCGTRHRNASTTAIRTLVICRPPDARIRSPPMRFDGHHGSESGFPVLDYQALYPTELAGVVRNQRNAIREGDRCDQQVVRTDGRSARFQLRTYWAIQVGCNVVECKRCKRGEKSFLPLQRGRRGRTLCRAKESSALTTEQTSRSLGFGVNPFS